LTTLAAIDEFSDWCDRRMAASSEYHMVERQVNNVTGEGAVGVPAQQV